MMAFHRPFRRSLAGFLAFAMMCGGLWAADKTVQATLVKVDVKKKILYVKTDDGKKEYAANSATKFIGPRGGVSDAGIKDDRLKPGASLKLVVAGNNRTLREVLLPERSSGGN